MTAPDSKTTPGVTPDAPTVSQQAAQAPDTQTSPVRVGSTMIQLPAQFGRYRLEKLLGKGGMGVVYLAHDTQLDRRVALKMPTEALAEGVPRERFFREARAAATLSHPNLCPVFDIGELDGVYYLTMPFIEGRPLSDYLQARRPMPATAAAGLCRVLARALHEAHEHGVCHRDLKPANILINRKKQPVITDFGLARRTSAADERLTQTGAVLGTPAYMSPEQVNGTAGALGPKCDVYALGVILYELLTQRRPFSGPLGVMLARIVDQPPPPPRQHRPDLDADLEAICLKALDKNPDQRYTMQELAEALDDWLAAQEAVTSYTRALEAQLADAVPAREEEVLELTSATPSGPVARPRRRLWLWLAGFALLFVVTCVLPVGWIVVLLTQTVQRVSDNMQQAGQRFKEQQQEQQRQREAQQQQQQEIEAAARAWAAPAADAPLTDLFPAAVGAFALADSDDKTDLHELNLAAPGRRGSYVSEDGKVEMFVFRASKLEKEALLRRAYEMVQRRGGLPGLLLPGSPSVLGAPEGTYLSYDLGAQGAGPGRHGVFVWSPGWLLLARSGSSEEPAPFLKEYLTRR